MTSTIKIEGMTCNGCVANVRKVLQALPGVTQVTVTLQDGQATIEHEPTKAPLAVLRKAIEDAGYDPN